MDEDVLDAQTTAQELVLHWILAEADSPHRRIEIAKQVLTSDDEALFEQYRDTYDRALYSAGYQAWQAGRRVHGQ